MRPKFPGMNPYLENPELWSEVHSWLIVQLARSLNLLITPKYRAAVEKRIYSDALLVGIPDVSVFERTAEPVRTAGTTTSTMSQLLKVTVPVTEEVRESYLEIREAGTGAVVTVAEVLSSKNKRSGEGQVKYDAKRQKILNSSANLVEIDLLRTGESTLVAGGIPFSKGDAPRTDYRILVSRADCRPEVELYPFDLRDTIPLFPLPLRSGDEEPVVHLQEVLDQVYQDAVLDLAIDYTRQPVPPVRDNDFAWIRLIMN